MLIKVYSAANFGVNSFGVTVEVNLASRGLPYFDIVGLPTKAVDESKHRVKTAILNSDIGFPDKRITINLAPADVPKEGSFYDLPIATGIICGISGVAVPDKALFFGELSLDGGLRHTKGAFLLALYAKEWDFKYLFVPKDCAKEAAAISGVIVYPVASLKELLLHIQGAKSIVPEPYRQYVSDTALKFDCDMNQILGQEQAKRVLEVAAAGGHNFFMMGPPGAGKTMLAKTFCSILPPLAETEALEVTKIYSAVGHIPPGGALITERPFRSPHHTVSYAGMVGGGSLPKPGEISLSHRGVLFMDEFPEFSRVVLEALRQPMEDGVVTISRSLGSFSFPSRFLLLASGNPCPCGFKGHPKRDCVCTPKQISQYMKKISGPIMDRMDLFLSVSPVDVEELSTNAKCLSRLESSAPIRKRVVCARNIQRTRFKKARIFSNAEMTNLHINKYCVLSLEVDTLLKRVSAKYSLSARAYFKLIKVARTIADLACSDDICVEHMAEAIQYRTRSVCSG